MLKELEALYPEGSDITIMNTFYQRPVWEDGKKLSDDFIIVVYKDNNTGEKKPIVIHKPTYIYYIMNDLNETPDYNKMFIERDKVHPVEVPFRDLEKSIAEQTNQMDYYKQCINIRDRKALNKLHTHPAVFFSDVNIENHYRFRFANTYKNSICSLHKAFFDIEVDSIDMRGDFPEMGECPINCVSYIDAGDMKIYTYILRDDNNPLIGEFEDEIKSGRFSFNEIKNFIFDTVGGPYYVKKYDLGNVSFSLQFYDKEIELIQDLFLNIHRTSPDFVEGWNSSDFDLTYIIERIKVLGYDPADIMCDPRWNIKIVKNHVDFQHKNELPERGDYTFISGLPIFIDQMLQYASRRKAKFGSFSSFKLDDIGMKEAKVRKLDYHHITDNIAKLPWLDFKTFVLYNIMDTVVQHCIEHQTQDLEYIFTKCLINNTIYQKGHRQTVYLINRMASDWYKQGFIIGNNCNRDNEKAPKYKGAVVHNPTHTGEYCRMKVNGIPIWVVDNLIDFDYKSLYPSVDLEFNIAPNTQIGKIEIPNQVHIGENPYMEDGYNRGGNYIDDMTCDNKISFCNRWLHLANYEEMLVDIDEFFSKYSFGGMTYRELHDSNCPIMPTTGYYITPIKFLGESQRRITRDIPSGYTYENIVIQNTKDPRFIARDYSITEG